MADSKLPWWSAPLTVALGGVLTAGGFYAGFRYQMKEGSSFLSDRKGKIDVHDPKLRHIAWKALGYGTVLCFSFGVGSLLVVRNVYGIKSVSFHIENFYFYF